MFSMWTPENGLVLRNIYSRVVLKSIFVFYLWILPSNLYFFNFNFFYFTTSFTLKSKCFKSQIVVQIFVQITLVKIFRFFTTGQSFEILLVKTTKKAILTYLRVPLDIKQKYLKSKYFVDVIEKSFLFDFQIATCF